MYVCVYVYVCMYGMCVYLCEYVYGVDVHGICVCVYVCVCVCMVCLCVYVCMSVYVCECVCLCVCVNSKTSYTTEPIIIEVEFENIYLVQT